MFEFLLRGFVGEYIDGKYVDDFGLLLVFRSSSSLKALIDIISAFPFSVVNYSLSAVRPNFTRYRFEMDHFCLSYAVSCRIRALAVKFALRNTWNGVEHSQQMVFNTVLGGNMS